MSRVSKKPLFFIAIAAAAAVSVMEIPPVMSAQEPAPAPGVAQGRAGGRGLGGGGVGRGGVRGGAGGNPPALRSGPAETTAAKFKDPNWKAPRTSWGHPDLDGV